MDRSFERLSEAFETSARRWELIVYPSLFGFILLAGYGFFLIYSLTRDIHYLAISVDSNMTVMASNFQAVSDNMNHLSANIRVIASNMGEINDKISTLEPMLTSIDSMDQTMDSLDRAINSITHTTYNMRNDMANINQNVSRPMSFLNTFMPW
ncbi:MAG: hypothetical protein H6964_04590 [Chromatiaceae bacterium]|nr:hypothetical protein [Gammaproteobacteria bacterium]MCP5446262.1 hypothetical protein [Chromatiaceae bacterium]MCB1860200.1 hypothetical protein [Gammaproteobacteria bacterium]MCB1871984.1 hypothetical protein [Gammaproteobacteria bacterium]MCB1881139.1 hypothetical protein [Gammaproteobacteria bacterium]